MVADLHRALEPGPVRAPKRHAPGRHALGPDLLVGVTERNPFRGEALGEADTPAAATNTGNWR